MLNCCELQLAINLHLFLVPIGFIYIYIYIYIYNTNIFCSRGHKHSLGVRDDIIRTSRYILSTIYNTLCTRRRGCMVYTPAAYQVPGCNTLCIHRLGCMACYITRYIVAKHSCLQLINEPTAAWPRDSKTFVYLNTLI